MLARREDVLQAGQTEGAADAAEVLVLQAGQVLRAGVQFEEREGRLGLTLIAFWQVCT